MRRFGGQQSPRSGAGWSRKNDGRTDWELVEFKRTDNRSVITLRHADLDALYRHAVSRPASLFSDLSYAETTSWSSGNRTTTNWFFIDNNQTLPAIYEREAPTWLSQAK